MNKLKLLPILFGIVCITVSKCIDVTLQDVKGKRYPVKGVPANCPGSAYCYVWGIKATFEKKYGFKPKYIRLRGQKRICKQSDGTYRRVLPDSYRLMSGTYEFVDQAPIVQVLSEKDFMKEMSKKLDQIGQVVQDFIKLSEQMQSRRSNINEFVNLCTEEFDHIDQIVEEMRKASEKWQSH